MSLGKMQSPQLLMKLSLKPLSLKGLLPPSKTLILNTKRLKNMRNLETRLMKNMKALGSNLLQNPKATPSQKSSKTALLSPLD
jgi:hypothetical protein